MNSANMSAESCEMLIKAGANVNAQSKRGLTPLICAIEFYNVPVVKTLLKHGAKPDSGRFNGKSTFEIAESIEYEPMIQLLKSARVAH